MFKQKKLVTLTVALVLVAAAVTLFSALGGGSALAARGGKGGSASTSGSATLTLSPNPVAAFGEYTVSGSGFRANTYVAVGMLESDTNWFRLVVTDSNGSFSFSRTTGGAGSVEHQAFQKKPNGSMELVATATLVVV